MSVLVTIGCGDGIDVVFGEVHLLEPSGRSGAAGVPPGGAPPTPGAAGAESGEAGRGGEGTGGSGSGGRNSGSAGSGAGGAGTTDDGDRPDAGGEPIREVDAGEPPALTPPPSDGSCGAPCVRNGGRCFEGACVFDCEGADSCNDGQVLCPPGRACDVRCGDGSCSGNVVCGVLADCNISCEGKGSCAREVICEGECNVTCSGAGSCGGGIGGSVELLDLECSGAGSCGSTVRCEGQECRLSCSGSQSCGRVRMFAVGNYLECSGEGSCGSDIACYGGVCSVECAEGSCDNGVECEAYSCDLPSLLADDDD